MNSIAIVGIGNVGSALAKEFMRKQLPITQIFTSKLDLDFVDKDSSIQIIHNLDEITADLCIVCVNDDNINDVINQISKDIAVVHTSGSSQLTALDRKENIGVFYPLQTITANRQIDFREVPFLIEATDDLLREQLFQLAGKISNNVLEISSEQRKKIHLAAVFMNNFVNHQIYLAEQLAIHFDFDKHLLESLLKETVSKAIDEGAYHAQTGPGRRRDKNVIEAQVTMLPASLQPIYQVLTESIMNTYNDKL